ncbi:MAG: hypothetical protein FJZ63_01285 [Chlamydiae bacterium]|nr:hypothetical protein [Chlamydiota bacterium]
MGKRFVYVFSALLIGVYSGVLAEDAVCDRITNEAKDKLESGFEKTAIGAVEIGVSVWCATKGDVIGAAGVALDGLNRIKDGVHDLQESKELFDKAREVASILESEPPDIIRGLQDHEY